MLFKFLTELGVVPRRRQPLHVQIGPVRLPGAIVPADEVAHVHLESWDNIQFPETKRETDTYCIAGLMKGNKLARGFNASRDPRTLGVSMKESENTTRYSRTYCKHKVVGEYQGVFRPGYDSRCGCRPLSILCRQGSTRVCFGGGGTR